MLVQTERLTIRPLEQHDAPLLVRWLSDPRVLQYYEGRDRPHDLALVHKHFYMEMDSVTPCLVQFGEIPIGYLQFYPVDDSEKLEYGFPQGELIFGMDQFIGEPDYWNKGLGAELVNAMVEHIKQLGANRVVMDPQAWNERALRCYEKCGFHKVKLLPQHEYHEGVMRDCWLIERNLKSAE